jgi:hypothetical protein
MTFPHPQSRKDDDGKGDIPNNGSVIREVMERTIDITDDRNAEDNVSPAKNRTFGGLFHDWIVNLFISEAASITLAKRLAG